MLNQLGVKTTGAIVARSPIDGAEIGRIAYDDMASVEKKIAASVDAFKAWRDVPAPRRGELVRLFGEELRANKDALGRLVTLEAGKILQEGLGEVSGDDRHLRFRRRPLAPALRPDHRQRTPGPPDDGDLASGGSRRRDLGVQLPRRGVGHGTRPSGAGLRRQRDLETVGEDAAHRAGDARAVRARGEEIRAARRPTSPKSCSACATSAKRWPRTRASPSSAPRARRAWGRELAPVVAARFGKSILELGGNKRDDRDALCQARPGAARDPLRCGGHRRPALHVAAPALRA